jgi:hypothetical protein
VDVALAPTAHAPLAAEVVGQDRDRRGALDEVRAEVADQRADRVGGPEREGGTDTGRLLPATVIERAGHLALLVEADAALFDRAVQRHEAEERNAVVTVEMARLGRVLSCEGFVARGGGPIVW